MDIPDTFVYGYLRENACLLAGGSIYALEHGGRDFVFGSAGFRAVKVGSMALLENSYLERHNGFASVQAEALKGLEKGAAKFRAKFKDRADGFIRIAKMVFGGCSPEKTRPAVIESILPAGAFFNYHGIMFPLFPSAEGDARIEGKAYCLGMNPAHTAENVEKEYKKAIVKHVSRAALDKTEGRLIRLVEQGFYDEEKGIGLKAMDSSLYAFTRISPYVLYERMNGKYYRFPAAEAGCSISMKNDEILFGGLKVIGAYKHPALQRIGKPMQAICFGEYSFDAIRQQANEPGKQVALLMRKARKALTSEYRSRGKPYHFLTEKAFDDLIAETPGNGRVSNGD